VWSDGGERKLQLHAQLEREKEVAVAEHLEHRLHIPHTLRHQMRYSAHDRSLPTHHRNGFPHTGSAIPTMSAIVQRFGPGSMHGQALRRYIQDGIDGNGPKAEV
jgi:hypothetical protein